MGIRTDMAVEAHDILMRTARKIDGITLNTSSHGDVTRTVIDITDDAAANELKKEKGRYVTIDAPGLKYSTEDYETVCSMISEEIRGMCPEMRSALVVGLGNRDITPDALGSAVTDRVIITSHMKKYMPEVFGSGYGCVSAISPSVMGKTGIETADIVKNAVKTVNPDVVIAVDALAGADIKRVSTSIQIADTGIAPGSGVGNHRNALNYDTLGVKVIAVGVPTVIAAELLGGENLAEEFKSLTVTVKDIDLTIKRMSKTVANGINIALHRNLGLREAEELAE